MQIEIGQNLAITLIMLGPYLLGAFMIMMWTYNKHTDSSKNK